MVDEIASDAVKAVIAYFGLKGLDRLLGPTLNLYGEGLRDLHSAGNQNLKKIFEKALLKVGEDIHHEGRISPRLFHHLIQGAPYCTDEISQEYFAGIIASSRTFNGVDYFIHHAALINRLPSFHIRLHYLFYHLFFACYRTFSLNMASPVDRLKMPIFVPLPALLDVLRNTLDDIQDKKIDDSDIIAFHDDGINNLYIEDLVGPYAYGSSDYFRQTYGITIDNDQSGGLLASPSVRGAELFCRAHGIRRKILPEFFGSSYDNAIKDWFTVSSERSGGYISVQVHFLPNEIAGKNMNSVNELSFSFSYQPMVWALEKTNLMKSR